MFEKRLIEIMDKGKEGTFFSDVFEYGWLQHKLMFYWKRVERVR